MLIFVAVHHQLVRRFLQLENTDVPMFCGYVTFSVFLPSRHLVDSCVVLAGEKLSERSSQEGEEKNEEGSFRGFF